MKRFIFALLCLVMLTSCVARIPEGEESSVLEVVDSETLAPETVRPPETDEVTDVPAPDEPERVTLAMVGDILLHEKVANSGAYPDGSYNYDHIFENLKDEISKADIALVNQEVILGGRELGLSGYPNFNGAFEVGDSLVKAGFDVILHATNHTLDKGKTGVLNCLDFWKTNYPDIGVVGINESYEEQDNVYVVEKNGIKIAFLNYTYGTNGMSVPSDMPYLINLLSESALREDVAKAEEIADFTVVLPHWGTEYIHYPDSSQKYWTSLMLSLGVDLVIGTHPHVVQPVEMIEDGEHSMLVYYSIGNFVNATAQSGNGIADRMLGAMADVTIEKNGNGEVYIADWAAVPVVSHVRSGVGELTVYKLSDYSEDLAEKNEIVASDPAFSYEYCEALAESILGENIE